MTPQDVGLLTLGGLALGVLVMASAAYYKSAARFVVGGIVISASILWVLSQPIY